ncbi:putative cytochrome p450 [Diplodia seriata]|uniref:Putative cytochrome p450 n=1 Tax=Diplodia seriata TaxID=420778 RepID=A0A0G2GXK1_9PEZI|nr:putative cytochrome p450 [Diplodia seriata]
MFGSTIYVVCGAADMATVWKRTEELTFDAYVRDLMAQIGMSAEGMRRLLHYQEAGSSGQQATPMVANPSKKPFVELTGAIFKRQLQPGGAEFDRLQDRVLGWLHDAMSWDGVASAARSGGSTGRGRGDGDGLITVSLLDWIRGAMVEGVTRAFFGDALLDCVDGGLLDDFARFDDQSWKLVYRLPRPWSTPMLAAQERVKTALARYFELPRARRADAAWMVLAMEAEMGAAGVDGRDVAASLFLTFWVINGNAWKLAFWMLAHLLFDAGLLDSVRAEVRSALADSTASSRSLCEKLASECPVLTSVYHEALRLSTSSIAVRNVEQATIVGGKVLQRGSRLIIPLRQILTDEDVFGARAQSFDGLRFLRQPQLLKSPSYRPFGGGVTYCPGRFLAKNEVLTCVALAIGRFDMRVAEGDAARIPEVEGKVPCIGIMKPVDGQDVMVELRPASQ